MTTQEEIQARMEKSRKAYEKRRAEQVKVQADIKEGVAYVHENKLPMMVKRFENGAILAIVTQKEAEASFRFAFALCSPNDQFSVRIAKGLAGKRLKDHDVVFSFSMQLIKDIEDIKLILSMGKAWLLLQALTGHTGVIDCIRRIAESEALLDITWDTNIYL